MSMYIAIKILLIQNIPLRFDKVDFVLAMLGVTTAQLNPLTSPTEGSTSLVTLGGEVTLATWTGGDL